MLAPTWTWIGIIPILAVALLVLYAPGVAVLTALRLRLWTVVAAGPLVTVTLVGVGGLLAWAVHLPWTPLTFAALALLAFGAAVALGRRWPGPGLRPGLVDAHRTGGVLLAAVIVIALVRAAAVRPGNFPQNPDMIFHLDLTRWFVDHASASSLDASLGVASPVQFYPAALHGLAATVCMITGAPPIIALTCVQLIFVAVAWPAALIALLAMIETTGCCAAWLGGALATALPIFPFRLLGYGPLWPFDAALALVPAWLALLQEAVRPIRGRLIGGRPLVLAAATLPGLALLHAGVALSVLLPAWFIANEWALSELTRPLRRKVPLRVGVALTLPVLVALGAVAGPASMKEVTSAAPGAPGQVLGEALRLWGGGTDVTGWAALVLLGLMVLGAVVSAWRGYWWLPATLATFFVLAVALHALGTDPARWLFWPWQNVVERLRALTGAFGLVAAVVGLEWAARVPALPRLRRPAWVRWLALVLAAALAAWLSFVAFGTDKTTLGNYYRGAARIPWLTAEEADSLRTLSEALPDDAVVVADPYNGGTFLSVVGPERLLIPTEKTNSDDLQLIADALDQAASRPAVCEALARHGAWYLLVGGDPASQAYHGNYTAFDRAARQPGFVRLAQAKPYTLYRIDACRR